MWRRFFWRACFLADQISLKGSWECKGGREGVRCGRPHQGRGGGLMLHPACRDALLVGRLGSSATPSSSSSSFPQNSPYKRGCHRALQKFWHQCRGCTLHMKPDTQLMVTNVFSEKSQVSIKHTVDALLGDHIDIHKFITHKYRKLVFQNGEIY